MNQYSYRRAQIENDEEINFIAKIDNTIPAKFDSDFIINDKMNEDRAKFLKSCKEEDFFEVALDTQNKIVAFHLVKKIPYFDRFAGRVDTLWVSPDHRQSGLASALKKRAEQWAITQGLDHLHTWVHSDNQKMISLNKKMGFKTVNYKMRKDKKDFNQITVTTQDNAQTEFSKSVCEVEIQEIIDRETQAWNEKNVELLLSIFHPDMVWVWPTDANKHDPMTWISFLGKFNYDRWSKVYLDWFANYELKHNVRSTQKISVTKQGDGAFAVVDIDTLWVTKTGEISHWHGRTCKTYTKTASGWKMISQVGVLEY